MITLIQTENATTAPAVGFVDCGGFVIPRAELADVLPDIARFERYLERAKSVSEHMTANGGRPPESFFRLSRAEQDDVAATLRELGGLAASAAERLAHERRGRP